jgi:hypothetical protein
MPIAVAVVGEGVVWGFPGGNAEVALGADYGVVDSSGWDQMKVVGRSLRD